MGQQVQQQDWKPDRRPNEQSNEKMFFAPQARQSDRCEVKYEGPWAGATSLLKYHAGDVVDGWEVSNVHRICSSDYVILTIWWERVEPPLFDCKTKPPGAK